MEEISGIRGLPFRSLRDAAALARQIVALQRHLERASAGRDLGSAPGALLLRLGVLRKMIVRGGHPSLTKEAPLPQAGTAVSGAGLRAA
ncbi:MAG: hypothetical protein ACK5UG_11490 [Synechococcaceae cyanobacterium]|jgi:hypothetical protein